MVARWLAPDLAMTAAMVSIVYLFLFFGGATALFRDSDAGWHIRAGERILASGTLPRTDPFSFSKAGEAWIAWEWLSDILMGGVHQAAGLNGVACLYALVIGASVWGWFRLNWAAGGNFLVACALAAPFLSTANLHWLARPHVLSWLFLLAAVWLCERMPARIGMRHLAAIGLAGSLWANMHGSFLLGTIIAVTYAAGAWLRQLLWDEQGVPAASYLLVGGAALAGSFVNPNGWRLHQHVLAYLSDSALLDRIGEFQSFNFHAAGSFQILLSLLLGACGGFAALSVRRPARFLLAMLLTAGALRSARLLPVAALLLLPLANGSLSAALAQAKLSPRARRALDSALGYGNGLRVLDRRMKGFALAPLFALALFGFLPALHPGFPADQFPVAASQAVAQLPASARLFTPDKFGGYLIYRFRGERKVFFDGRSDFYGADFLLRYSRIVQVRPGWDEEFARWRFTHALLPAGYSLIPALQAKGWTELYRDSTAVLLGDPKA
ncbi:MAG: hypothetical protein ABUS51_04650 [Acidobacteriota bacterium]